MRLSGYEVMSGNNKGHSRRKFDGVPYCIPIIHTAIPAYDLLSSK